MKFVEESCCECGVLFQMTEEFAKYREEDHRLFYCPNGHAQHYTGEEEDEENTSGKCQNCGAAASPNAKTCEYCGGRP